MRSGAFIVYTSADSVFQIAAHEDIVPIDELYRACEIAFRLVGEGLGVGRVIARPFVGVPGRFVRTAHRRDYALSPFRETLLDRLKAAGHPVVAIGKVDDLFAGRGVTEARHTASDDEGLDVLGEYMRSVDRGLLFANLVDFDTQFGHRNDVEGYARNLERFDLRLAGLLPQLSPSDLLVITADHGNDPTTPSTDHSREYVPLLATGARSPARHRARHAIDIRRPRPDAGVELRRGKARQRDELPPRDHRVTLREQLEAREREVLAPQAAKSADSQGAPAPGARRRRASGVPARSGSHHPLQGLQAPQAQDAGLLCADRRSLPDAPHAHARGLADRRTIAKVLRLHEELTEAITLGHDLGHTPFGHAGERIIDSAHAGRLQPLRAEPAHRRSLENDGRGLNLTWEVRDGIAKHSKGKSGAPVGMPPALRASTVEGQIMRVADLIAYVNHDIDDATRAGLLRPEDLPQDLVDASWRDARPRGSARSSRTWSPRRSPAGLAEIRMSAPVLEAVLRLRSFLFDAVYENLTATAEFRKASGILSGLWEKVQERPEAFLDPAHPPGGRPGRGHPGFHRRDDRSVRRPPVRGAVHPQALVERVDREMPAPARRECPAPVIFDDILRGSCSR